MRGAREDANDLDTSGARDDIEDGVIGAVDRIIRGGLVCIMMVRMLTNGARWRN